MSFYEQLQALVTKPSQATLPEFALLYGRPGGGKSHTAATISEVPGVNRVLIIDTEGSTVGTLAGFDDSKIDIIRVDTYERFMALMEWLLRSGEEIPYDAVVIDTFDVAQDRAVKHFQDNAPRTKNGEKDGFAAWGNIKKWTLDMGQDLRNAPFKVVVVFHETEDKMSDGSVRKNLALSGSAKDVFPGIPDMVVWLERKMVDGAPTTIGYFETEDNKVTKNRFGFPPVVQNVSFPGLFKFIEDKQNNKKED